MRLGKKLRGNIACNDNNIFDIDSCPPQKKQELNLFIFQLTNRDKIRILAIDSSSKNKLIKLDSISIALNAITTNLFISDFSGSNSLFSRIVTDGKSVETSIWDAIFGAYIIEIVIDKQNVEDRTDRPITFHDYCQKNEIFCLNIFSYGSLFGIPFYIGFNKIESKYLIDYYNIINRPHFISKISKSSHCESEILYGVTVVVHDGLKFSTAEATIILNEYKNGNISCSVSKGKVLDSFEKSEVIHFACHAEDGRIRFNMSEIEIKIGTEDVKKLNLSRCGLVVMNACRTSEDPRVSLMNKDSLPLAFLEAGAQVVISTTKKISDDDAFRFSVMLHEKINNSDKPVSLIFREVLLDCKEDSLPFFEDRLEEYNFYDLSSHMKYLKKYGSQERSDSWKYYAIWENNYV